MKIEVKLTDKDGNVQIFDVTDSVHFHCILQPHYDGKGRIDGVTIISGGKITGHIDPCGEEGCPGTVGITDHGYEGVRTYR